MCVIVIIRVDYRCIIIYVGVMSLCMCVVCMHVLCTKIYAIRCSTKYIDAIRLCTGTCARANEYMYVSQHEGMLMYSVLGDSSHCKWCIQWARFKECYAK